MAEANAQSTNPLENFVLNDGDNFFGIKEEGVEEQFRVKADDEPDDPEIADKNPKEEEDKPNTSKPKKEKEEQEEEEVEFFEIDKEEKSEDSEEDTDENSDNPKIKDEDTKFYSAQIKDLVDRGIFKHVKVEDNVEIDEDKFYEYHQEEVQGAANEIVESIFEELDDEGIAFLKFKKNGGGSTADFLRIYGQSNLGLDSIDIDKEEDQDKIIRQYASSIEKMDSEEISDKIEWLKENGKKKAFAEKYLNKLSEMDKANKEALIKQAEDFARQRDEDIKNFNLSIKEELDKTESVKDFDFSKVDKKELTNYITRPTVKVGKNRFITQFQADLGKIFNGKEDNKQSLLLLAKLVKTDFDIRDIVEKTKTKVTKEAKSKLQQARQVTRPSSSGNAGKKTLADFFNS